MSSERKRREIGFRAVIALVVVAGLLFVLIPIFYGEHVEPPILRVALSLLEKVGDALLIAAILAVFVERNIGHEHFNRLIVEIFGRKLPKPLVDHIQTYFKWDFVRTNWDIVYTIEQVDGSPDDLTLHAVSSYDMENMSDQTKTYAYSYSVEVGHNKRTPTRILEIEAKGEKVDIANRTKTVNEYVVFADDVSLEPSDASNPRKYAFRSVSVQGFRDEKASPYWALHPVVGATFTIYYPTGFSVEFDATFEKDSGPGETLNDRSAKGLHGKKWTIDTPILPGQGFLVRCTKVPAAT
jgi:hypothetical protein